MIEAGVLERRVRAWRAQGRRAAVLEGLLRLAGGAAAALAAALWADRLFALPQAARAALWAAGAFSLAWAAWRLLLRPLRRLDEAAALEAAGRRHPQARPYLKPAWELSRGGAAPQTSAELARAHVLRTERLLEGLPACEVFEKGPSAAARRLAAAGAAGLLAMAALGRDPAWQRVLLPWTSVALERFVSVQPGDADVETGRPQTLRADWKAGSPVDGDRGALRLYVKGAGGWREAGWDRLDSRSASFNAEAVVEPLEYRVGWRDLRTRVYTLTPTLSARLESARATIHSAEPEIVALSAAEPLSAIAGSYVTVRGSPNQPLSRAELKLSSLPAPIPMKKLQDGDYEAGFTVTENATFEFALAAADGRASADPIVYRVVAKRDEPPQAQLLSPLEPVQASNADTLPVAWSARDDGGVRRVTLIVRAAGRPAQELEIQKPGGRRDVMGDFSWDLSALPRGRTEFAVKAYDTASPVQSGVSQTGVVEIVDFQGPHDAMERQWLDAERRLGELARREEQAGAAARKSDAASLSQEEQQLAQDWPRAAQSMSRLSSDMAADAYANPGMAAQAQQLAQQLRQAAARDVPAALRATKSGDLAASAQAHEKLARRLRQAQKTLAEGRKVQALQDFYARSGRMSQDAQSLQSSLEAAAARGKASKEDAARLDKQLRKLASQLAALQKTLDSLPKVDPNSADARGRRALSLPVDAARRSADALSRALQAGDFAAAARLAQQLSQQLEQMQKSIADAASAAAASAPARQAQEKIEQAEALWSEVVDEQTRSLEQAQRVEDQRLASKLAAERKLLDDLAREQDAVVAAASARRDVAPDVMAQMRAAQAELDARKIERAPDFLRAAAGRLASDAAARKSQALAALGRREDAVRQKLEDAPNPRADAQAAGQAEGAQRGARDKTAKLGRRLEELDGQVALPDGARSDVAQAQQEQRAAEDALSRGDSSGGVAHEQAALKLLSNGSDQMGQAAGGQRSIVESMGQPFQRPGSARPGGGAGAFGARTGFVPLPSSSDYQPPRELREELLKSLQESRPPAYDPVIKEYFKRISQ